MNCKPGDLAYIVVPKGFSRLLDGKFVNVLSGGECDLGTFPVPGVPCWLCEFHVPWLLPTRSIPVRKCWLRDEWLRPIRDDLIADETPAEVNMPEAFKIALGIEMRTWA